jgi:hypothetical protein
MRALQQFVQPFGVNFRFQKIRFGENSPKQSGIRFNSGDGIFFQRSAQTRDGFFSAVAPCYQFTEQRIVVHRYGPAFVHAFVHPDSGTTWLVLRKDFAR